MTLPEITTFPILIISTPRTGSNYLGEYLGKKYNIRYFLEPDSKADRKAAIDEFFEYKNTTNRYLIKIQSSHLEFYPSDFIDELYNDTMYRIILSRHDRVAQIASLYLAFYRLTWGYSSNISYDNYNESIEINDTKVNKIIDTIRYYHNPYHFKNFKFDLELFYEDLEFVHDVDVLQIKTPLPCNYDELLTTIKQRIKNGN